MVAISGRWVLVCREIEFHLKDGVCQGVYHKRGAFSAHVAVGWRAVGVIGPPRARQREELSVGESLILAKNGEIFYTPPIDALRRVRKSRATRARQRPERPAPREHEAAMR